MASTSKKRKVSDECRVFQERWTDTYLFVEMGQKPVCLVCNESISVMKEFNLKRHYETKHAKKFDTLHGQLRSDRVLDLKRKLKNQQFSFLKPTVFELREAIKTFMQKKDKSVNEFDDPLWVSDLAFCADITYHLNVLNKRLQGPDNFIHNIFDCIKSFECKLNLWQNQLKDYDFTHFEKLSECEGFDMNTYVTAIEDLKEEFNSRFLDFKKSEILFDLFSRPFSVKVIDVPGHMQMELTDLQYNSELKEKFTLMGLSEFYSKYIDKDNFPHIRMNALKMMSLFGSTYRCEQLFSKMAFVKNKNRSRITNVRLENSIKLSTSKIRPNIEKLVKEMQHQSSH